METWEGCSSIVEGALKRLEQVSHADIDAFRERLKGAGAIFCAAQGRSGYILRCFCMRLMHLGFRAHFSGDTATPAMGPGDLLVVLSGSGRTSCTCSLAAQAKAAGGDTFGLVGTRQSPLERCLDGLIHIPDFGQDALSGPTTGFVQPLGSAFEQTAFILLEAVLQALFLEQGGNQGVLQERHANLE